MRACEKAVDVSKKRERFQENRVRKQEVNVTIKSLHHYHIHIAKVLAVYMCIEC